MGSKGYFGVQRGGRVILPSLHQPPVTTTVSKYGKLPQWSSAYPKLQSLTRRGYNVTKLQEQSRQFSVGHAAGLTSVEHAFQPIDSKRFASAWAEVRAGHAIPRLRDATAEQWPADSTRSLASHSRVDVADTSSNIGARRRQHGGSVLSDPLTTSDGASVRHSQPSRTLQHQQQSSESSGRSRRAGSRLPALSGGEMASQHRASAALSKDTSGSRPTATDCESAATTASVGAAAERRKPRQLQPLEQRPPQRLVVPRREAQRYMHAKLAYLVEYDADKRRRKEKFVNQLRTVIERAADLHNRALENLEARRRDARERQERQLLQVRERFDSERCARLRRQHVSRNALLGFEGAAASRAQYGLPEHFALRAEMPGAATVLAQSTEAHSARRRRRGRRRRRVSSSLSSTSEYGTERFDERSVERMHSRLSHRYEHLFNMAPAPTFNPRAVTPKLEGYDTVEVAALSKTGGTKKKRVLAEDVIKDAVSALKAADATAKSEKNSQHQPPAATAAGRAGGTASRLSETSTNGDDEDDEEIFERLFRKYNIIIEDD